MPWIVGVVYLAVGVLGFLVGGSLYVPALNMPDHYLHLVSAVLLLIVGVASDRRIAAVA